MPIQRGSGVFEIKFSDSNALSVAVEVVNGQLMFGKPISVSIKGQKAVKNDVYFEEEKKDMP